MPFFHHSPNRLAAVSADGSFPSLYHLTPAISAGVFSACPEFGGGYPRLSDDAMTCVLQAAAPLAQSLCDTRYSIPPIVGVAVGVDSQSRLSSRDSKLRSAYFASKTDSSHELILLPFHTVSQGSRVLNRPFSNVNLLCYDEYT